MKQELIEKVKEINKLTEDIGKREKYLSKLQDENEYIQEIVLRDRDTIRLDLSRDYSEICLTSSITMPERVFNIFKESMNTFIEKTADMLNREKEEKEKELAELLGGSMDELSKGDQ